MRKLVALVVLLGCACAGRPGPGLTSVAATVSHSGKGTPHATPDGLSFRYPDGWFVQAQDTFTFVTNFKLGATCCEMADGQVKIDLWSEPARGRTLDGLRSERCSSGALACSYETVHGLRWLWILTHDEAEGASKDLLAVARSGDRLLFAAAFVPDGAAQDRGLAAAETIYRSFSVRAPA